MTEISHIATNFTIWTIRDKTEVEKGGLVLPGSGKEKPHSGTIISVGELVKDSKIKRGRGKKALFHKGIGQELEYKEVTYLILLDHQVIGVD